MSVKNFNRQTEQYAFEKFDKQLIESYVQLDKETRLDILASIVKLAHVIVESEKTEIEKEIGYYEQELIAVERGIEGKITSIRHHKRMRQNNTEKEL